jgi:hypothetical protein
MLSNVYLSIVPKVCAFLSLPLFLPVDYKSSVVYLWYQLPYTTTLAKDFLGSETNKFDSNYYKGRKMFQNQ